MMLVPIWKDSPSKIMFCLMNQQSVIQFKAPLPFGIFLFGLRLISQERHFWFTRELYHYKENTKTLRKKYIWLKFVVCRPLTTKKSKNGKFGKSRSKKQKIRFLKKTPGGIRFRVLYTKNQLPRLKTVSSKMGESEKKFWCFFTKTGSSFQIK